MLLTHELKYALSDDIGRGSVFIVVGAGMDDWRLLLFVDVDDDFVLDDGGLVLDLLDLLDLLVLVEEPMLLRLLDVVVLAGVMDIDFRPFLVLPLPLLAVLVLPLLLLLLVDDAELIRGIMDILDFDALVIVVPVPLLLLVLVPELELLFLEGLYRSASSAPAIETRRLVEIGPRVVLLFLLLMLVLSVLVLLRLPTPRLFLLRLRVFATMVEKRADFDLGFDD